MRILKRAAILITLLCMIVPMCLVSASADEALEYKLYHESMDDLEYNKSGLVSVKSQMDLMKDLYAQSKMLVIPETAGSSATMYMSHQGSYPYDGLLLMKAKVGDWVAMRFRSPGDGVYSIDLGYYYHNANNASKLRAYLLPGSTPSASIGNHLTNENKIGEFDSIATQSKTFWNGCCTTGVELKSNRDYILVVKVIADGHEPDANRVDMMFTGLTFGAGYEPPEGAFDPIAGEVVADQWIKTAEFYNAFVGVNPANGHDLLYLLLKGSTMYVYDLDEKEVVDTETNTHSTPFGQCLDPDGNLWMCGAGAFICKYDPTTGVNTKYNLDVSLFGDKKVNSYGILYADDGYIYFTYWGWIARLDPKTGTIINLSGTQLNTDPTKTSDAQFSGHGGMIYKDGYLYLNIFGDLNGDQVKTSQFIKYSIAERKIVDYMDISDSTEKTNYGVPYLNLVGEDLIVGNNSSRSVPLLVDISGDKMVRLSGLDGLPDCFIGYVSSAVDGKVYAAGYVDAEATTKCMYEMDVATRKVTRLGDIVFMGAFRADGAIATIDDPLLPGVSMVVPLSNSATGMVDVAFYNAESRETVYWSGITEGFGSGMSLRATELDPTGRYIYGGAYGTNQIARYDTQTGDVLVKPGYSHQTDSMFWYKDFLWIGNYSSGTVTRYDPETYEPVPLFNLMDTVFQQKRMFALTAADDKVFCGTIPDTSRQGGALVWYDIKADLTYVAAGPNSEDVYYARTTGSFTVWRNVVTNQIETFDLDGDGFYDFDVIIDDLGDDDPNNDIKKQCFYGVVDKQCMNYITYKDGYIIGTTTRSNGQAAVSSEENAKIFAYDIAQMKLVATCDVSETIAGLENPNSGMIDTIDFIQEDPYEPGKFWGVICDTLFSCTFDMQTHQFAVKEELSLAKGKVYRYNSWKGRNVFFDGDYMYLSFHSFGVFMVNTADPSLYYQISRIPADWVQRAADGNLYYYAMAGVAATDSELMILRTSELTQPIVAKSAQQMIDALPDAVTMADEEQVMAVYRMYSDLIETTQATLNTDKLFAALDALGVDQAAKAESLIGAIGEVTLQSEEKILIARRYYDSLPAATQASVTKLLDLELAEETLADLKNELTKISFGGGDTDKPGNNTQGGESTQTEEDSNNPTFVILAVVAAVVIAGAVALFLLRKKAKK